jgi:hypothetical protein
MSSVLKDTGVLRGLTDYMRWSERQQTKEFCSPYFTPPIPMLKRVFDIPFTKELTEEEEKYYRKEYKKNCKELVNRYLDRLFLKQTRDKLAKSQGRKHFLKYIWKGDDVEFKAKAEILVNSAIKATELALPWSVWFTSTTEGEMLIEMIKHGNKVNRMYGLAILFSYLQNMYIQSGYDDLLFHQKMVDFLPMLKDILIAKDYTPLMAQLTLFISGMFSSWAFLKIVKSVMSWHYNIPPEFFDSWYAQPDDEEADALAFAADWDDEKE